MMAKRPLFFIFLILCLGIWICNFFHIPFLFENIYQPNHIKNFTPNQPRNECLIAIIVTDPVSQKTAYKRLKTTFTAKALALNRIEGLNAIGKQVITCGLVNVVSFDDRDAALEYGDVVLIKGALSRPQGPSNPGIFNYREYLARQDIYSVITVGKGDFISVLNKDRANKYVKKIFNFKHRLKALIEKYLAAPEKDFLIGVLLGDRSGINDDLKDRFVKTGTVHILAISGLHVGIIASILVLILRSLYLQRYIVYSGASILLIAYAILTGTNIPAVRATIMAVAVLIGMAFYKKADILNCIGLSGIAILLKKPLVLFDAGFQLSFATVISIILFAPKFDELLRLNLIQNRLVRYLARSISVSLAAWLGIIPIIAYHFNIISPVCIIANIPVIFLLTFVVAGGLSFLSFGLFMPTLAEPFALATGLLANILIKAVILFSKAPLGFFWTHKWGTFEITIVYVALGLFAASLYNKKLLKGYSIITALLLLNMFIWQADFANPPTGLQITVLDVGHGDAIVLELPDGGCALIDAGSARGNMDIGEDILDPYLRSRRIQTIDAVFVTHPDNDHVGGMAPILKNFKVKNIFDLSHNVLKRFDRIVGFKGVDILVLSPPEKDFFANDSNNNSTVLKVTYAGRSFLFCADIQEDAMRELLKHPLLLKSDVIKIAHHGAGAGPIQEVFLGTVSPKVALISASSKDVSDSLLNFLFDINCRTYKTYADGAITLKSFNGTLALETYN